MKRLEGKRAVVTELEQRGVFFDELVLGWYPFGCNTIGIALFVLIVLQ